MENQSGPVNKVTCRKCGGPHFTIKCGKEKVVETPVVKEVKPLVRESVPVRNQERPRQYFKNTFRVKISDLPLDMTEEEMMELTCDWGHIVRINVINYEANSVAFIDFGYEEEANYFVEALDKTPFEMVNLLVSRVESTYRKKT